MSLFVNIPRGVCGLEAATPLRTLARLEGGRAMAAIPPPRRGPLLPRYDFFRNPGFFLGFVSFEPFGRPPGLRVFTSPPFFSLVKPFVGSFEPMLTYQSEYFCKLNKLALS